MIKHLYTDPLEHEGGGRERLATVERITEILDETGLAWFNAERPAGREPRPIQEAFGYDTGTPKPLLAEHTHIVIGNNDDGALETIYLVRPTSRDLEERLIDLLDHYQADYGGTDIIVFAATGERLKQFNLP